MYSVCFSQDDKFLICHVAQALVASQYYVLVVLSIFIHAISRYWQEWMSLASSDIDEVIYPFHLFLTAKSIGRYPFNPRDMKVGISICGRFDLCLISQVFLCPFIGNTVWEVTLPVLHTFFFVLPNLREPSAYNRSVVSTWIMSMHGSQIV